MRSRHEVILNGVALGDIHESIYITDIEYHTPEIRFDTFATAKRHGARIRREYLEQNSVTVSFMIREYDVNKRRMICSEIARWSKDGGILETGDRKGQRLRCIRKNPPMITSALNWTDELSITFTAYAYPFWEEKLQSVLTLTGTSGSGNLYVPGDIDEALIEASITANAALTSVTLQANGKSMILSGLSVASGQTIVLSYDEEAIQSIKVGNTSLLAKRTGADDLIAKCGETNSLSMTANASVTTSFKVRGVWL